VRTCTNLFPTILSCIFRRSYPRTFIFAVTRYVKYFSFPFCSTQACLLRGLTRYVCT
jgi:hypothetical protein